MNVRNTFRTGVAALMIAASPMAANAQSAAKTAGKEISKELVSKKDTLYQEGEKWIHEVSSKYSDGTAFSIKSISSKKPKMPKDSKPELSFNLGGEYATRDIVGLRQADPRFNIGMDLLADGVYVRPQASLGAKTYEAVLPLGYKAEVGKGVSVEAGADLAGVRGFWNKEALFQSEVDKVTSGANCHAMPYRGEFFQDLHAGVRYQNDVVNASVRGEVGRNAYIDRAGFRISEAEGVKASELVNTDIPIVATPKSTYVGARASVDVTPLKNNKNFYVNANGAISTNRGPEATVGVGYKF